MSRASLLVLASASLLVFGCAPKPVETKSSVPKTGSKPSRAAVKRGLDDTAQSVAKGAKDITIAELMKLQRPQGLGDDISTAEFQDERIAPLETQVWRLKAHVKSIIKRKDGDYFLTIDDGQGHTTVVEVPDPELCKGSAFEKEITDSRKELEAKFHPTDKAQTVNAEATIEGVGFWGQKPRPGSPNAGSNGARLMPGTHIEWSKGQ